jgi:peptidyl-prolyl cis-trans isomerase SurA
MNKIKSLFLVISLLIICSISYSKENAFIIYNIDEKIITNIDLKKEVNYLTALNNQLKNLDKKQILGIAEESIVREAVKEIELNKFFDLKQMNPYVDIYIKELYSRLNLKNEDQFQKYLKNYGLSLDFVKEKVQIEIMWNQLVYDKFRYQIKIDKKKILKEIKSSKNKRNEKIYLLSEIVFEIENKDEFNEKKEKIEKSINEIGFKNSANIYSISDSSKFGGEIGWIAEKELSKKIFNEINNLEINQYTKPILTGSSFLILKIDDLKYEEKKIDLKEQQNKKIKFETDRQLQQFSKIYYNKVKINTNINEL